MDDLSESNCDINSYNAESIVHSLVMPPLLSPQLEDMTNCSFYENFTPEESQSILEDSSQTDSSHTSLSQKESKEKLSERCDLIGGSLKLAMLKTDLCDVIGDENRNHFQEHSTFDFSSKVDMAGCSDVTNDLG